ncbi:hypothetical protein PI124_g19820 [Phytophthora idaei]|nr:hypothetical protein PI125_g22611 [Phytophthora idaei]KAG3129928.1 hypothetical protein PI126_g20725 [Phytophthora idaei]KAG3235138.1 hypothetical protein PI124_g19820 [Phytophthora idaei]
MEVLAVGGAVSRDKLDDWLITLGNVKTPLDNEEEVHIESNEPGVKSLMLKLLRAYWEVSTNDGGCPPLTTLDVQHHIDTAQNAEEASERAD